MTEKEQVIVHAVEEIISFIKSGNATEQDVKKHACSVWKREDLPVKDFLSLERVLLCMYELTQDNSNCCSRTN